MVNAKTPWAADEPWEPIWVVGTLRTQLQSTNLGQTGYALSAEKSEEYVW